MSKERLEAEVHAYFNDRFGVNPSGLAFLQFQEKGDEIWASSDAPPVDIHSPRLPGLRALRRTPHGLKPTSAFLACIQDQLRAATVELDLPSLTALLLGRQLDTDASDGFVALTWRGDTLGCGRALDGHLAAMIPTGRRRELLEALADERTSESPNL